MFLEDFIDFIKFVFVICIVFVGMPLFALGAISAFESYTCDKYEEATGVATKYTGFTCYINTENGYMTYEEYKVRNYINHSERSK